MEILGRALPREVSYLIGSPALAFRLQIDILDNVDHEALGSLTVSSLSRSMAALELRRQVLLARRLRHALQHTFAGAHLLLIFLCVDTILSCQKLIVLH